MLLSGGRVLCYCVAHQKSYSPLACSRSSLAAARSGRSQRASWDLSRKEWLAALTPSEHLTLKQEVDDELVEALAVADPILSDNGLGLLDATAFVLGIDPDVSGAMAVLPGNDSSMVEVFDVPSVRVMVGSQYRRRHDPCSIVSMIKNLSPPAGSVAYIEQNSPLPKDGKQGWWGSGFGYGIWIGTLVASGISVVPVSSSAWKRAMGLSGKAITKDDCRACASLIFPSLAPQLNRKKDHGRAEALLIAAYGKGIPVPPKHSLDESSYTQESS